MTDKLKKFRNKHLCKYCHFLGDSKEKLEKHQEQSHGRYSLQKHIDYNKGDTQIKRLYLECMGKKPKTKSILKKVDDKPYVRLPIYKKPPHKSQEDNPNKCYIMEDEIRWIQPYNNGSYDIYCKNCLSRTHTTKEPNPEEEVLLCSYCGMNAYIDNRKEIYNWLHKNKNHKLHKSIRMDVIMSGIKPNKMSDKTKSICIPVINNKGN